MALFTIDGDWAFETTSAFTIDSQSGGAINLNPTGGVTINIGEQGGPPGTTQINMECLNFSAVFIDNGSFFSNGVIGITAASGLNLNTTNTGDTVIGFSGNNVTLGGNALFITGIATASNTNVLFIDPSGFSVTTGPVSSILSGAWLVGNNSGLGSPANFGTSDAVEVDMYANGHLVAAMDTSGNFNVVGPLITINTVTFTDGFTVNASTTTTFTGATTTVNFTSGVGSSVNIASGWQWLWESGASLVGNSGSVINWGGTTTFSGTSNTISGPLTVSGAHTTILSQSTIDLGAAGNFALNIGTSTTVISVAAASMQGSYTGAVGYNIGASGAGGINIQSSGTAPFLIGAGASGTFTIINMPNSAAGAGVYTNANIGAGKAYLVIDTTSGLVTSVTPS